MFKIFPWVLVVCCTVLIGACSDPSLLVGKYQSPPEAERRVVLELLPNGEGTWETDFDVVSFRWKQRGYEIWLHTRTGGVITGDIIEEKRLEMDIPGVGMVVLKQQ